MPQVYMIIAPSVQPKFSDAAGYRKLQSIGWDLIAQTEKVFGLEKEDDTAFTAVNAVCVLHESEIQIEIRYTAGEDEYGTGEVFAPSKEQRILLADSILEAMQEPLRGIAKSVTVWVKPYEDSVFKGAPIR